MHTALVEGFRDAIEGVCRLHEQGRPMSELIGIGLMCGDEASSFGPCLLDGAQVPADAERDFFFNPPEWGGTFGLECFDELNASLESARVDPGDSRYPKHVRKIFDCCAEAVRQLRLRERFGEQLFVTMGGFDPNSVLEAEERRFVELVNPPDIVARWIEDFG